MIIKTVDKNDGEYIGYEIEGTKITFGDDEMMLNLTKYERDEAVVIDICRDTYGNLITGAFSETAVSYAAQVSIPAREYERSEAAGADGGTTEVLTPVPLDTGKCTLTLWRMAQA